jgi:hypothetical protein
VSLLPLDSPRWLDLGTAAGPGVRTVAAIKEVLPGRFDGGGWLRLFDLMVHQGTIFPVTYAALPHVLAAAAKSAAPASFWVDIGYAVSAIDSRAWHDVPRDLVPACDAAIAAALPYAIRAFDAARDARVPSLYRGKPISRASKAEALALACIALARHPVGQLLWSFVAPPRPGEDFARQMFCRAMCPACEIELEWMHCGDGILEYSLGKHDPSAPDRQPPFLPPPIPMFASGAGAWAPIARSLEAATGATDRSDAQPTNGHAKGSGPHRAAAADLDAIGTIGCAVASAGVPQDAPNRAVICLAAAMIALHGERDWARRFARLASDMRCPACDAVSAFVACLPELA